MKKWSNIYKEQITTTPSLEVFIKHKLEYKKKLLDYIRKYAVETKKILEVGCGSGITTTKLGLEGYTTTGIDSDPDMITLAQSIAKKQRSKAVFKIDDIRSLSSITDYIDVIFSNGVMEHFSDEDIVSIVNLHLLHAHYVIISIPSNYFSDNQKIHGDERFMSTESWRKILSAVRGKIIDEFNFESDKPITNIPQFIGFVLSSR